jgi:hypothetical protein
MMGSDESLALPNLSLNVVRWKNTSHRPSRDITTTTRKNRENEQIFVISDLNIVILEVFSIF